MIHFLKDYFRLHRIDGKNTFLTFGPKEYLSEYYSQVGLENLSLLEFFIEAYKDIPSGFTLLEFGGGPTIYQLIAAAKYVEFIHFAEHLQSNIEEVKLWLNDKSNAFNWDYYIYETLRLESLGKVDTRDVEERKRLIKRKITAFIYCNALDEQPLGKWPKKDYDVVSVNFVAESITSDYDTWRRIFKNIATLIKKDGYLIMTIIKDAKYYQVGTKRFPAVSINERHVIDMLGELGFYEDDLLMRSINAEALSQGKSFFHGYNGMIFLRARRK